MDSPPDSPWLRHFYPRVPSAAQKSADASSESPAARALRKAREDDAEDAMMRRLFCELPARPAAPLPSPEPALAASSVPPSSPWRGDDEPDMQDEADMQDGSDEEMGPLDDEEKAIAKVARLVKQQEEADGGDSDVASDVMLDDAARCWEASEGSDDEDEAVGGGGMPAAATSCQESGGARSSSSSSRRTVPASGRLVPASASSSASGSRSLTQAETYALVQSYKGQLKGTIHAQRDMHRAMGSTCFQGFKCKSSCKFKGFGESCLEEGVDRRTFQTLHAATYGRANQPHTQREMKAAVHAQIWELRSPLPSPGRDGVICTIPEWRLGGANGLVHVCKDAFKAAVGGTNNAHRYAIAMTLAGKDPTTYTAQAKAAAVVKKVSTQRGPRSQWAVSWWRKHLLWQDWLPNEVKIQYRGPHWSIVHSDFYKKEAQRVGLVLEERQWTRCRAIAIERLHQQFYPTVTDRKLSVTRSARHSKFPECTNCQLLRRNHLKIVSAPNATAEQINASTEALLRHAAEWQGNREKAYDLRQRCSVLRSTARYQVDDKCGSFWQAMPVSECGRDHKQNATAKYKFSVQANVVAGEGGVKRFTIVPKNICTGANFGLTNLLMTIFVAHTSGNLQPQVETFYRHTDGGPDNVSVVSHFVHWLLVYLGVFNEIIWFRFQAGV